MCVGGYICVVCVAVLVCKLPGKLLLHIDFRYISYNGNIAVERTAGVSSCQLCVKSQAKAKAKSKAKDAAIIWEIYT